MIILTIIDHFTVLCSVTRPLNTGEAAVDLALIQTSLALRQRDLHKKSNEVCIKARSTPAPLVFKGLVTEHRIVKWSIPRATPRNACLHLQTHLCNTKLKLSH